MDSAAALPAGSQSIVPAFFHSQEGFFMGTDRPGPGKCGFSSEIFDYIVQPALGQLLTQAGCQMTITHIKNRGVKTFYDDKYVSRDIPALRVAFPKI